VPPGAVVLVPGQSIQQAVDSKGPGTVFFLPAGTYVNQTITPKTGNKFVGEAGTILTGSGVTEESFRGTATDVTIQNLTVERYRPSSTPNGAINPDPGGGAARWLIDNVEARYNGPGAGIKLANYSTIRNSKVHHNGKVGITAWQVAGSVVEGTEIAYNNWDPANPASTTGLYDYLWDAGGSKFVSTTDLVLRANNVHHNLGIGLWCDIDCRNTRIENNNVHDNAAAGMLYEISYGALITGNSFISNGLTGTRHGPGVYGGGIAVTESRDVEVVGNTVAGNEAGIMGQQAAINGRGGAPYGPYVMDNFNVHDNDITSSDWTSGLVQYVGDNTYFTSRNIRFQSNTYRGSTKHYWNGKVLTFPQWQGMGLDLSGSLV
jgi:parallel beta-helix repeat protein